MRKTNILLSFSFILVLILGGCKGKVKEKVKEKVKLRSGKELERIKVMPGAKEVKGLIDRTFIGKVKLLPAPGSDNLPIHQRTTIVAIDLENGKMIIPIGLPVNELRKSAVGKKVVFEGRLQRRTTAYGSKHYGLVEVKKIIRIE